jgi:hypothetical protein
MSYVAGQIRCGACGHLALATWPLERFGQALQCPVCWLLEAVPEGVQLPASLNVYAAHALTWNAVEDAILRHRLRAARN